MLIRSSGTVGQSPNGSEKVLQQTQRLRFHDLFYAASRTKVLLSLDGGIVKSIAENLTKLNENSVTKDDLSRILVRLLAKGEEKK